MTSRQRILPREDALSSWEPTSAPHGSMRLRCRSPILDHMVDRLTGTPVPVSTERACRVFLAEWFPGLPGWAVVLVAAALLFAETALLVGLVIPAELTLLLVGLLAHQGVVDLAVCLPVFIVAGVLGDQASYWSGRLIDHRTRRVRTDGGKLAAHWRRAELMLLRWGGPAVLIGRWIPFVRTLMPVAAGATRLKPLAFLVFAGGGVVLWMTATVLIGYFAGGSLELTE